MDYQSNMAHSQELHWQGDSPPQSPYHYPFQPYPPPHYPYPQPYQSFTPSYPQHQPYPPPPQYYPQYLYPYPPCDSSFTPPPPYPSYQSYPSPQTSPYDPYTSQILEQQQKEDGEVDIEEANEKGTYEFGGSQQQINEEKKNDDTFKTSLEEGRKELREMMAKILEMVEKRNGSEHKGLEIDMADEDEPQPSLMQQDEDEMEDERVDVLEPGVENHVPQVLQQEPTETVLPNESNDVKKEVEDKVFEVASCNLSIVDDEIEEHMNVKFVDKGPLHLVEIEMEKHKEMHGEFMLIKNMLEANHGSHNYKKNVGKPQVFFERPRRRMKRKRRKKGCVRIGQLRGCKGMSSSQLGEGEPERDLEKPLWLKMKKVKMK